MEQDTGQLRVGDTEREAVVTELTEHHAHGRLDAAELDERLEAALGARTAADLAVATRDLPALAAARVRPVTRARRRPVRPEVVVFLVTIVGLWLVWALTGAGHPWPIYPMLGWGLPVLAGRHGAPGCRALSPLGGRPTG